MQGRGSCQHEVAELAQPQPPNIWGALQNNLQEPAARQALGKVMCNETSMLRSRSMPQLLIPVIHEIRDQQMSHTSALQRDDFNAHFLKLDKYIARFHPVSKGQQKYLNLDKSNPIGSKASRTTSGQCTQ